MVGSACAICGVLVIALPVSVVASNFSIFYTYIKARLNVPPKKRRVTLSHALTSMHTSRSNTENRNQDSLCSEDRRTTGRSAAEVEVEAEASYTSLTPSPQLSIRKPPLTAIRSLSNLLKPTRHCMSRSLSSLTSEVEENRRTDSRGIMVTLETPTRASSYTDIPSSSKLNDAFAQSVRGALLQVPFLTKLKDEDKQNSFGSFGNFCHYPLHLRRGAVSPASFSIKSTSTTSSYNQLHKSSKDLCNALKSKGPIIVLSEQSLQSLNSLHPNITFSCASLMSSTGESNAQAQSDNSLAAKEAEKQENGTVNVNSFTDAGHPEGKPTKFTDSPRVPNGLPYHSPTPRFPGDGENSKSTDSLSDFLGNPARENMFLTVPIGSKSSKHRSRDRASKRNGTLNDFFTSETNTHSASSESETCDNHRRENPKSSAQKTSGRIAGTEDEEVNINGPWLKVNSEDPVLYDTPSDQQAPLLSNDTVDNTECHLEVKEPITAHSGCSGDRTTPKNCIQWEEAESTALLRHEECYDGDTGENVGSGSKTARKCSVQCENLAGTRPCYNHSPFVAIDLDFSECQRTTQV